MAVSRLSQSTLQNAFSKYNSVWDGVSTVGSMEAISSITLSANQNTIEFNNIPQTYSHLHIRGFAKTTNSNSNDSNANSCYFNGDSSTNYNNHYLYGTGSSVVSGSNTGGTSCWLGWANSNNYTSSNFTSIVADVLDYTSITKAKVLRYIAGNEGGYGYVFFGSGLWFKNSSSVYEAINRMTINAGSGNFMTYSSFTLYGVK